MSNRTETMTINLQYHDGLDEPEKGVFRSAVVDPAYADELLMWVEDQATNDDGGHGVRLSVHQVNLCGTRRSLYELGCYLVALSRFETADKGYHDHFDELAAPDGKLQCELIIHSPVRVADNR